MNNNGSPATDMTQCHAMVTPHTQAFQKSKVSVAHLNAQSIKSRNHLLPVRNLMTEKEYGILVVSEYWLNSSVTNAEVEIEGYKLIRLDHPNHRAGGVCVYVRRSHKSKVLKDLSRISDSGFHQLWVQVQQKKLKSFLLCVTYRTPDCPLSCFVEDFMDQYLQALTYGKSVLVVGDLNCDLLTSSYESRALNDFCGSLNMKQLITEPKRVTPTSESLIDWMSS